MKYEKPYLFVTSLLFACSALVVGCTGGGSSTGTATASIVLSASPSASFTATDAVVVRGSSGSPVPIEDIESLTVTVTRVILQRCGGEDDDTDESGNDLETVIVEDNAFDPTSVTVEQGGTVRWVWTTNTLHTITSGLIGDLDAGSLFNESADAAGAVIELIFEDTGEYPYFSNTDSDIADAMTGTVNVVADDDSGSGDGGQETVFEGAIDVNILDLTALSEVLTMAEVPAGDYCRIILHIENPRLVLVADPNTVLTNVQITANGRLFLKDHFVLEDGANVIIVIDFGSIHLVDAGASGKYVLTPQLRADVDVEDAEVEVSGEIVSTNAETMIIEIDTEGDGPPLEVVVSLETVIQTDDDADDVVRGVIEPTVLLEFADLAVGQEVAVEGLLTVGGQILADEIEVADDDFDTTI